MGNTGSILGLGRSSGEGNDKPFQYPCLGNPMDRGARWASVHGVERVGRDLPSKPPPINRGRPHRKVTHNTSLHCSSCQQAAGIAWAWPLRARWAEQGFTGGELPATSSHLSREANKLDLYVKSRFLKLGYQFKLLKT